MSNPDAMREHIQIAEQMRLLRQMHMDAKYAEERARRIQQLDDPRQVRQMLGVIAARKALPASRLIPGV